jgi:TRIAD3 protein (E3 ubiquitin-protein ligase RNF216)
MARARVGDAYEVVDLAEDSEDELVSEDEFEFFDAQAEREGALEDIHEMHNLDARYSPFYEVPDGVIDLTGIPDIDVPPSNPTSVHSDAEEYDNVDDGARLVPEAIGLQMILDFLPDISIDHVLNLLREKTTDLTRSAAQCQGIIMQLVEDGSYPREADESIKRKRKRDDEDEWEEYDKSNRDPEVPNYETDA